MVVQVVITVGDGDIKSDPAEKLHQILADLRASSMQTASHAPTSLLSLRLGNFAIQRLRPSSRTLAFGLAPPKELPGATSILSHLFTVIVNIYPSLVCHSYFFEALFLTSSLASWSLRPSSSSLATRVMSSASPRAISTLKYCPKATPSSPFSTLTRVVLEMPARSAIWAVVRSRLKRAYLICSPPSPDPGSLARLNKNH